MNQRVDTQWKQERTSSLVMAIGFLTFYTLPDGIPFLMRLTMMVTMQAAFGRALKRRGRV